MIMNYLPRFNPQTMTPKRLFQREIKAKRFINKSQKEIAQ